MLAAAAGPASASWTAAGTVTLVSNMYGVQKGTGYLCKVQVPGGYQLRERVQVTENTLTYKPAASNGTFGIVSKEASGVVHHYVASPISVSEKAGVGASFVSGNTATIKNTALRVAPSYGKKAFGNYRTIAALATC